jgi:hypothetical protein
MKCPPAPLVVKEIPFVFRERAAGESKLDVLVMMQFGGLLADKIFAGFLPLRFLSFALVGALAHVPAAGTGGIHLEVPLQAPILQQLQKDAFGRRGAADVTHADKQNFQGSSFKVRGSFL